MRPARLAKHVLPATLSLGRCEPAPLLCLCAAVCAAATAPRPIHWQPLPSSPARCRPVQPHSFGVAHLAAVNVLVVSGAFCAALLAAAYNSQVAQWQVRAGQTGAARGSRGTLAVGHGPKVGPHVMQGRMAPAPASLNPKRPAPPTHQPQGGMLFAVLLPTLGLGLPFALAIFPVHAFRWG